MNIFYSWRITDIWELVFLVILAYSSFGLYLFVFFCLYIFMFSFLQFLSGYNPIGRLSSYHCGIENEIFTCIWTTLHPHLVMISYNDGEHQYLKMRPFSFPGEGGKVLGIYEGWWNVMKVVFNLFILTNHLKITISLWNRHISLKSYAGHFSFYVFHKIELNFCFL